MCKIVRLILVSVFPSFFVFRAVLNHVCLQYFLLSKYTGKGDVGSAERLCGRMRKRKRDSGWINTFRWLEGDKEVGEGLLHCIMHARALLCIIKLQHKSQCFALLCFILKEQCLSVSHNLLVGSDITVCDYFQKHLFHCWQELSFDYSRLGDKHMFEKSEIIQGTVPEWTMYVVF